MPLQLLKFLKTPLLIICITLNANAQSKFNIIANKKIDGWFFASPVSTFDNNIVLSSHNKHVYFYRNNFV